MKNKFAKIMCLALIAIVMPCCILFAGCSTDLVAVKDISYTRTEGLSDIYTITYTNGTTSEFRVKNGADGAKGEDGKDAQNVTITEIFEKYKETHAGATYEEFLKEYLSFENNEKTKVINECLLSSFILYSEFKTTEAVHTGFLSTGTINSVSRSGGSGILYRLDNDYAYIITNYHVVYNSKANADNNGKLAYRIVGYLYGSEGANGVVTDENGNEVLKDGYQQYNYGKYGIEFEFVGGSAEKDLAVLRTNATNLKAINSQVKPITFADEYVVGGTAIAIGNIEGMGISITEGVVSVDSEYITLSIDQQRKYRSMRIDTAIYHGSSGGGLFNEKGQLIGITNSGDEKDENINYAIPLSVVKNTVENIMYYYSDEDETTTGAYKVLLGVTVQAEDSKYVYDKATGKGRVVESIGIVNIGEGSIVSKMSLAEGDILSAFYINGTEYVLDRNYELGDLLLNVREGDVICFKMNRGSNAINSATYTITKSDLVSLA